MKCHVDIESRSPVDLTETGVYVYAEHPETDITMVAWAFDQGEPYIWYPMGGAPTPAALAAAMSDPTVMLGAHNSGFERIMLSGAPGQRIGMPPTPRERWDCTAARAARMGLPRSLDNASAAAGLQVEKDLEGARLMRGMMRPRKLTKASNARWVDDDVTMRRVGAYCMQDVRVEQAIDAFLPPLSADERAVWLLTEKMNDRGVMVDTNLLTAVLMLVDETEVAINAEIRTMTGCICGGARVARTGCPAVHGLHHSYVTKWLVGLGYDDLAVDGVGKAAVAAMLERDDIPLLVRQVMLMRREGGGTASSKFATMMRRMSSDGAIRGSLVYCGAASTGRWSSRGVQLQNLLRMILLVKPAALARAMRDVLDGVPANLINELHGPPLIIAGELLRPTLVARPGHWLARGDSKQIEARVLPWMAGARWKLDAFERFDAGTGPDLYKVAAAGIYRTTPDAISDQQRQIGKVSELALGFEGGANALQSMARNYGMKIPGCPALERDELPPVGCDEWIKQAWRRANPECSDRDTGLWSRLTTAAIGCMQSAPGVWRPVGRLAFARTADQLLMRLPSGRSLVYWTPKLRMRRTPWGVDRLCVTYRSEDPMTHQWREFDAYGGLWTENAVQATARDLMAFWMVALDAAGLTPVLTVHDEGVCEATTERFPMPDMAAAAVEKIMKTKPKWAEGLPVSADSSAGPRYVK